ncbi:MAG: 50S ribosomal protein L25 [Chloroflexi bacterium]|nr:50S ribosomal protein L25 [Chloroflexota bacterium]
MSQQVELAAVKRTVLGKHVKQLRREGLTPGVMYGRNFESVSLQFEARNLQTLLSQVGGSQLISVNVEGEKQPNMVLIRDVQRDPIRWTVLHVDFYRVDMAERLTTEIPLEIVGDSPVVVQGEGILLQGISAIEVECLPGDLVDAIEVDLTNLVELDQGLYVRDLAVPSGIDILTDVDEMIVRVVPLAAEEELEALEDVVAPEFAEVEVITEAQDTDDDE